MKKSAQQKKKTVPQGKPPLRSARLPRSLFCMTPPRHMRVHLVYPSAIQITEGAAGSGQFKFYRLNSAYDVDTNIASTSMPGYNEWSQFFSNYRVLSAAMDLTGTVSGISTGSMAIVSLTPNPSQATLPGSAITWSVQPNTIHAESVNTTSGGKNVVRLRRKYNLAKCFGVTPQQFRSDFDFTASTGANPLRQLFVAVTIAGIGSSTPGVLTAQLYVSMTIEFFNPILLNA